MLLTELKLQFPDIPNQVFSTYIKQLSIPQEKVKQRVKLLGETKELILMLEKYRWRKSKRVNTGKERLTVCAVERILNRLNVSYTKEYNGSGLSTYRADFKVNNLLIEVKHNVTYHSIGQALFYRYLFDLETVIVYGGKFDCAKTDLFAKYHKITVLLPTQLERELKKRKVVK